MKLNMFLKVKFLKSRIFTKEIFKIVFFFSPARGDAGFSSKIWATAPKSGWLDTLVLNCHLVSRLALSNLFENFFIQFDELRGEAV